MKTTNEILSACCWVRAGWAGAEQESLAYPFSRGTEDGTYDIATCGKMLLAIGGRDPHYSTRQGPERIDALFIYPRDGGAPSFRAIAGESFTCSTKQLGRAARAAERSTELAGRRALYLSFPSERDPGHVCGTFVDADYLLLALAAMHRAAPVVVTMTLDADARGEGSLDVVGLLCDKPWDDCSGRIRALVMPVRGPLSDGTYTKVDLVAP